MVSSLVELQRAQVLSEESIAYGNFYDALKTEATKKSYTYGLNKFMRFLTDNHHLANIEDYETLAGFDQGKSTDLVKMYIKNIKKNLTPPSVNAYVAGVLLFFATNRTALFLVEIKGVKDKNDQVQGGRSPVTDSDLLKMIRICNHPRDIALILFLSSTGMRPGGLTDPVLQMKHLVYMPDLNNPKNTEYCYGIKIYDGFREGYWVFLTPEATTALNDYFTWRKLERGEKLNDDSPIFAKVELRSTFAHMTTDSAYRVLRKVYKKSSLIRIKVGNRFDKAITYMHRIRFNTILKLNNSVNSNIAEKLMAHKKGLDGRYLQPTREECYAEFFKSILQLTVDPSERLKIENEQKNVEITELEEKNEKFKKQEDKVDFMETNMYDMSQQLEEQKTQLAKLQLKNVTKQK